MIEETMKSDVIDSRLALETIWRARESKGDKVNRIVATLGSNEQCARWMREHDIVDVEPMVDWANRGMDSFPNFVNILCKYRGPHIWHVIEAIWSLVEEDEDGFEDAVMAIHRDEYSDRVPALNVQWGTAGDRLAEYSPATEHNPPMDNLVDTILACDWEATLEKIIADAGEAQAVADAGESVGG